MTPATTARLQARGLVAGHRDGRRAIPVVGPVDLAVQDGRFVAVLGPNGAGKTTLLRALAGVSPALAGEVTIAGTPLGALRREERARTVAVVLTDHPDVGLLSAADVVGIGRHPHTGWSGRLTAHDREVVAQSLSAVGAADLGDRPLGQLSDGQRQRIWIARALAQEPQVLLLDEPTAFLDLPGRVETVALLRRLAVERDLAVVAAVHDLDLALRIADRVWLVDIDGGVIDGAPEDLALTGAIDTAFGRADVRFDLATASFATPVDCCIEVRLVGLSDDPVTRLWTERALGRAGAIVTEGGGSEDGVPDGRAWLTVRGGEGCWTLHGRGDPVTVTDLDGLVHAVRRAAVVQPHART